MSRKDELQKIINNASEELWELEQKEKLLQNKKLVGKCYKFRDNYSFPQSEEDYWWLYKKIISMDDDGYFKILSFETDKDGLIRIDDKYYDRLLGDDIEISEEEFFNAWQVLVEKIHDIQF